MRTTKFLTAAIISLAFLVSACTKTGPQGAQGPQGEKGDKGQKGDKGDTGSANVIYSDWFTAPEWDLLYFNTNGYDDYYRAFTESTPELTQDIFDKGVILAYIKTVGAPNIITLLPWTDAHENPGDPWIFSYDIFVGSIRFQFQNSIYPNYDPDPYGYVSTDNQFRYILIPGSIETNGLRGNSIMNKHPDYKNYDAVCKFYGIPK